MTLCCGLFHHMQERFFDYYDRNRTGQLINDLTAELMRIQELHYG